MNYRTISLIARYEMKAITREWSFKIVILLSVLIVTLLHFITLLENPEWIAISLPSAIPFANAYLVNFLQIILAIFWAGNFLKEDKYQDTNSSVSVRPFSNIELLFGKTFGFLLIIFCLDIVLGGIVMFIHVFATESPFAFYPYIFYFFTLTCPALLFATGLVICVKGMIRNFALSNVIILALLYFALFPGKYLLHGIFDPLALGLPNAFSDFTGFPELSNYLLQRFTFLAWGCGLIILGITFVSRISNNSRTNFASGRVGILFLMFGVITSGIYVWKYIQQNHERGIVREVFVKYQNLPKVSVLEHDIEFRQDGYTYLASSKLKLFNQSEQKVDSVILYLNPGLDVLKLVSDNGKVTYHREQQVLVLAVSMLAGETKEIEMDYRGDISSSVCYAEVMNIDSLAAIVRGYYMYHMGRDYHYLQPDYTLLTPECLWYPVSKPTVNVVSPYLSEQNFTRFKLCVNGETTRIPIAQGDEIREGDKICFVSKYGLPGLTLCIGDYVRKGVRKDDVLYEVFLFEGHEYLLPKGIDLNEFIEYWVDVCEYEDNKAYVFNKLNLVETPIHFCAYSRDWKNSSEYVYPEIIYRPEREALFPWTFRPKDGERNDNNPTVNFFDMYSRVLTDNVRDVPKGNMFFNQLIRKHMSEEIKNENDISFLLPKYHYYVYSAEFVGMNLLFHEMQEGISTDFENWGDVFYLTRYLNGHSLEDVLQNPDYDINVGGVIYSKGYNFFKYILCSVSSSDFKRFNTEFLNRHAFESFSYEKYCVEVEKRFGVNLLNLTRRLYTEYRLPAFYFRDAHVVESLSGENGYTFSIKVWNKGSVAGLLSVSNSENWKEQHYVIPANACKEINFYLEGDKDNCKMKLFTNMSQNLPSYFVLTNLPRKGIDKELVDGIFDSDTLAFAPEPGVFIVDNEDPGCRVVEDSRVMERVYKREKNRYTYKNTRWSWWYSDDAYGELVGSFLEKVSGNGISSVEWCVDLPESGVYEVFVYNNRSVVKMTNSVMQSVNGKLVEGKAPIQTYYLSHGDGEEIIEISPLNVEQGWVSLGVYQFNSGTAKITLSGQGADQYQHVIADAVKWVKVK